MADQAVPAAYWPFPAELGRIMHLVRILSIPGQIFIHVRP